MCKKIENKTPTCSTQLTNSKQNMSPQNPQTAGTMKPNGTGTASNTGHNKLASRYRTTQSQANRSVWKSDKYWRSRPTTAPRTRTYLYRQRFKNKHQTNPDNNNKPANRCSTLPDIQDKTADHQLARWITKYFNKSKHHGYSQYSETRRTVP